MCYDVKWISPPLCGKGSIMVHHHTVPDRSPRPVEPEAREPVNFETADHLWRVILTLVLISGAEKGRVYFSRSERNWAATTDHFPLEPLLARYAGPRKHQTDTMLDDTAYINDMFPGICLPPSCGGRIKIKDLPQPGILNQSPILSNIRRSIIGMQKSGTFLFA